MELEYKQVGFSIKEANQDTGIVEAIVSVFGNVDKGNDRIMQGAFAESIQQQTPKVCWMHQWDNPIAKTVEIRELAPHDALLPAAIKTNGGLYVKGQFFKDIENSWQAFLKIKHALVDEFSIGYRTLKESFDNVGVRNLEKLFLKEWSPVLYGMNDATAILGVKSDLPFEQFVTEWKRAVEVLCDRVKARKEVREKAGRVLSGANVSTLTMTAESLLNIGAMTTAEGNAILALIESAAPKSISAAKWKQKKIEAELLIEDLT